MNESKVLLFGLFSSFSYCYRFYNVINLCIFSLIKYANYFVKNGLLKLDCSNISVCLFNISRSIFARIKAQSFSSEQKFFCSFLRIAESKSGWCVVMQVSLSRVEARSRPRRFRSFTRAPYRCNSYCNLAFELTQYDNTYEYAKLALIVKLIVRKKLAMHALCFNNCFLY